MKCWLLSSVFLWPVAAHAQQTFTPVPMAMLATQVAPLIAASNFANVNLSGAIVGAGTTAGQVYAKQLTDEALLQTHTSNLATITPLATNAVPSSALGATVATLSNGQVPIAQVPVGTASGTVAAGNDSRIVGAAPLTSLTAETTRATTAESTISGVASGAVQTAGGNASATMVKPSGATTARALSSSTADAFNVLAFGAVGDNVSDNQPAVQAAETAASGSIPRLVTFTQGQYQLHSSVLSTPGSGAAYAVQAGAAVGGTLQGMTDGTALYGNADMAYVRDMIGTGLENVMALQSVMEPTTSTSAYQKNGLYIDVQQNDNSTGSYDKDAVGEQTGCIMGSNSLTFGRCFGIEIQSGTDLTGHSDGYVVGAEIGVGNYSGTTGAYGQNNSKLGMAIVAAGNTNSTAGIVINTATTGKAFLDQILGYSQGTVNNFLRYSNGSVDLFHVSATGGVLGTSLQAQSLTLSGGSEIHQVLQVSAASSAAPGYLTADGNAFTTANCVTTPNNSSAAVTINVTMYEPATGQTAVWFLQGQFGRLASGAQTGWTGTGSSAAAPTYSYGSDGSAATITVSTDTAGGTGCLLIKATPGSTHPQDFKATVSGPVTQ